MSERTVLLLTEHHSLYTRGSISKQHHINQDEPNVNTSTHKNKNQNQAVLTWGERAGFKAGMVISTSGVLEVDSSQSEHNCPLHISTTFWTLRLMQDNSD